MIQLIEHIQTNKLVRSQIKVTAERGKVPLKSIVKRRALSTAIYVTMLNTRTETALDWNARMRRMAAKLRPLSALGRI